MILLFTDFGTEGPYLGQVKAVLHRTAPKVPVVDLFADAPVHDPRASAYLLASFAPEFPAGSVFVCVVDPGVGGSRAALMLDIDGRWFVGPDNGLFEPLLRRSGRAAAWRLPLGQGRISATFHGRDLFAPAAAHLAAGRSPSFIGAKQWQPERRPEWPDDLAEVVYVDRFGNLMSGIRAAGVDTRVTLAVNGTVARHARIYGDVPKGQLFWYENSNGLVEVAVNQGRASDVVGASVGTPILLSRGNGPSILGSSG